MRSLIAVIGHGLWAFAPRSIEEASIQFVGAVGTACLLIMVALGAYFALDAFFAALFGVIFL